MGIKTILNEFIAYVELSKLPADALDPRSRLIMLYAMCGFANFGSLGIMIGGLATMAPERRDDVLSLGLKSIVSGTLATCLIGAIVGVLISRHPHRVAATPPVRCRGRAPTSVEQANEVAMEERAPETPAPRLRACRDSRSPGATCANGCAGEAAGQLKRIDAPVDPDEELAAITFMATRRGGRAGAAVRQSRRRPVRRAASWPTCWAPARSAMRSRSGSTRRCRQPR